MSAAVALVQRQLDAYNARDLDAFADCYAAECVISGLNGAITETGREALRRRYARTFAESPDNRARLLGRIHLGDVVIDHEHVSCGPGKERFEVIAIYTVKDGRIAHVDFVK